MNTTVGVFSTHKTAEDTIKELRSFGVPESDLSYLYVDVDGKMQDDVSKVGGGVAEGATIGAVVGAIAGLVVANVVLPGIGTIFVAGPLAVALGITGTAATAVAGAATGLAAGGILGGLTNMGIDRTDAALYQSLVEKGDVLLVARNKDLMVKEIFIRGGANEIREYTLI